ncbi:MAG: DNA polymerase III, subunit gamma and tau [Acidobacteria bacterium 13_1_40CM_4_58_4]|nr:MAG: DNA polymerase III, subunit gamma and tau [Acidobacteria bacterium 13_1_40CM_4_58_4]
MSYQVLARKYRPQKFSEVIGQEHVTRTLKNAIAQGRTAHGYIFSGHRGIGKTTVARILAMALNCRSSDRPVPEPCGVCESCSEIRAGNSVDVIEIDAATNRGIDEIRELREAARYRPARDRFKIYILDEAHQITDAAFNALLKTLEEPPSHVVFMLATTQPEDIPQTIRSRCQHFSFRAVRFEEILGQLKDLAAKEKIEADEDALALLAEAGDGSMRDALSILDQAIASSGGRLTAEQVRQLVGAAPSGVLEAVMRAVAQGSSEEVLRLVNRLISEGHSPTHFARQMVRFLRNTVVAKVAGGDSSLLQISSDERQRVSRVAELFTEEDLARHLQIMLRTHGELGYRQEQRFHLEIGLLKMAHAQRLLPIEQLLSEAGVAIPQRVVGRPSAVSETRKSEAPSTTRSSNISPFAADSARKGGSKPELSAENQAPGPRVISVGSPACVVMGAAAPAAAVQQAPEISAEPEDSAPPNQLSEQAGLRQAVLSALADGGHRMLTSMLEAAEWQVEENELRIKVAASATVLDMSLGVDAKRLMIAAASGALGRPVKLKVIPGGTAQSVAASRTPANGGGRSRAEQDPVVRRMKEKFGAEIRTIIDYRERR